MRLLIITQRVDATDPTLGFFVRWIEEFAKHAEVTVISWRTGLRLTRFFRYQYLLLKYLPKTDGVFFHMCPEYVLAAHFLPTLFRVKTALWYVHGKVSWRLRLAEKLVHRIFTASPESFRLPSKKVEVVGHGVANTTNYERDTKLRNTEGAEKLHLVTVGRISPIKHLKTLLRGFTMLQEKIPAARFSIIGSPITSSDRAYEKELRHLAPAGVYWGSAAYGAVYAASSPYTVFVHASKTGSLDKAVLEALAAGLPVFTSSEAFHEKIPGITKFREGDPKDLAEKISRAFESGKLVIQTEGREFVKVHHSLPHLVQKIVSFYAKTESV